MSLTDRTNETIPLSLHDPLEAENEIGYHLYPAEIEADADADSSTYPFHWVAISVTDAEHDSDTVRLTYGEAGLLADRLDLILGRVEVTPPEAVNTTDLRLSALEHRIVALIGDLDAARATGSVQTYGQIQERLRAMVRES